jgi:hypothetical protein
VNWLLRPAVPRADLPLAAAGAFATVFMTIAASRVGGTLSLGFLLAFAGFFLVVLVFIVAPHVAVACTIPIFALIPALKVLVFPWIGPLKDLIALAAICAAAILMVQRASAGRPQQGDRWVAVGVGVLALLYVVNAGGLEWDIAWSHGVRLVSEPLALLLVGMTLDNPRRVLRWAMASLVATAVFVALIGLYQQILGMWRLYDYGYEFDRHLRTFDGHLRSFGTLDEPFAYAAFLLLGLTAVVMWVRNGAIAFTAASLIVAGVAVSFVRTALVIGAALLALWLSRRRHTAIAVFLMAVAVVAAVGILLLSRGASEQRTVRTDTSTFLTVNGRTEAWRLFLGDPEVWVLGHGVGEVGTAAERATYSVSRDPDEAEQGRAVDSGYFAVIADVGLIGLAALLGLFGRLITLATRAQKRGLAPGWIALALLTVLLIDAVTRASFTGFPTAFLGLLLVGVALGAATADDGATTAGAERRRAKRAPADPAPASR